MPAALMKAQTLTSFEMLPSQLNFGRVELRALAAAEQRLDHHPRARNRPMTVPSLRATL